jgi:hypothetical protein
LIQLVRRSAKTMPACVSARYTVGQRLSVLLKCGHPTETKKSSLLHHAVIR